MLKLFLFSSRPFQERNEKIFSIVTEKDIIFLVKHEKIKRPFLIVHADFSRFLYRPD